MGRAPTDDALLPVEASQECAWGENKRRVRSLTHHSRATAAWIAGVDTPSPSLRPDTGRVHLAPGPHAKGVAGPLDHVRRALKRPRELVDGLHVRWDAVLDAPDRARRDARSAAMLFPVK